MDSKNKRNNIVMRIWNSPVFMTWGGFLSRSLSLLLVTPLVLRNFTTEDICLWLLFANILILQMMIQIGFAPTFIRVIAYAMGGATPDQIRGFGKGNLPELQKKSQINWDTVESICVTMRCIYWWISIMALCIMLIFGSLALENIIEKSSDSLNGWIAWSVIAVTGPITLYATQYAAYLQGINKIALIRRWETFFSLCTIGTNLLVMCLDGNLLFLVCSNQSWAVVRSIYSLILSRRAENGKYATFKWAGRTIDKDVWRAVWPSAWRSGVGMLMASGILQASGLFYAQVGKTAEVASYLFGLKIITTIRNFSQAPFYTKIPILAKLFAEGNLPRLIAVSKRGMMLSFWIFVLGVCVTGIAAEWLLNFINSNVCFPSSLLWCLFGMAFFVERYGAMQIQLYSLTNHIIWHIANGFTGCILLLLMTILFPILGIKAYPISMLVAYLAFYSWYAAKHSYLKFNLSFIRFDGVVMLPPLFALISFFALSLKLY